MSEETQLMENSEISAPDTELAVVDKNTKSIADVLASIDTEEIVYKTNCKFCCHPARTEAEKIFDTKGNMAIVERFFEEYEKLHPEMDKKHHILHQNIGPHLTNHHMAPQRATYIREYRERVNKLLKHKYTANATLAEMKAIAQERLMMIASNPNYDAIKGTDAVVKLIDCISGLTEKQEKYANNNNGTEVVAEKFQNAMIYVIKQENDDSVKRRLLEALDVFQEKVSGNSA